MFVTLVIAVMVSINTLYVAAEFSAVSVRRSRLEELARSGNHAARRVRDLPATARSGRPGDAGEVKTGDPESRHSHRI